MIAIRWLPVRYIEVFLKFLFFFHPAPAKLLTYPKPLTVTRNRSSQGFETMDTSVPSCSKSDSHDSYPGAKSLMTVPALGMAVLWQPCGPWSVPRDLPRPSSKHSESMRVRCVYTESPLESPNGSWSKSLFPKPRIFKNTECVTSITAI